jgi:hypothetical protein
MNLFTWRILGLDLTLRLELVEAGAGVEVGAT